ncbi:MAG: RadC family protein [Saezia sp.]
MLMKNLPSDMRPREKLMAQGVQALADVELLALLLRTGTKGRSVLQMAQELLNTFGGLSGLLNTTPEDLKKFKGLGGTAKRAELISVLEIARRTLQQQMQEAPIFSNPSAAQQYLQLHLGKLHQEVFAVLFLDVQHKLLAMKKLFFGTLTHTSIYPREVVLQALQHHAHAVVLAHNHPSGNIQPSIADKEITEHLKKALSLMDIEVLDHIIVGQGQTYSMAEHGWI